MNRILLIGITVKPFLKLNTSSSLLQTALSTFLMFLILDLLSFCQWPSFTICLLQHLSWPSHLSMDSAGVTALFQPKVLFWPCFSAIIWICEVNCKVCFSVFVSFLLCSLFFFFFLYNKFVLKRICSHPFPPLLVAYCERFYLRYFSESLEVGY